jgi:hypothetical protein
MYFSCLKHIIQGIGKITIVSIVPTAKATSYSTESLFACKVPKLIKNELTYHH